MDILSKLCEKITGMGEQMSNSQSKIDSHVYEETIYALIYEELEKDIVNMATMTKAISNAMGEEKKAKALYIKYRFEMLKTTLPPLLKFKQYKENSAGIKKEIQEHKWELQNLQEKETESNRLLVEVTNDVGKTKKYDVYIIALSIIACIDILAISKYTLPIYSVILVFLVISIAYSIDKKFKLEANLDIKALLSIKEKITSELNNIDLQRNECISDLNGLAAQLEKNTKEITILMTKYPTLLKL